MPGEIALPKLKKNPLTEEERAKLAQKLDDDLEKLMEKLASKKEKEEERKPFNFDEFCHEIDSHPIFMKELKRDEKGEFSPEIQALQAMKYEDNEEEDHQFTAEKAREEGNRHFKLKKYHWAIDSYTNGLKARCMDRKLNGKLCLNRATSHKHLGNYRSAIKDCAVGRKFDPTNLKIVVRGAECLIALGYAGDTIRWIESSKEMYEARLPESPLDEEARSVNTAQEGFIQKLLETANKKLAEEERDKRKARAFQEKDLKEKKKLLAALEERGIRFSPRIPLRDALLFEWSMLEVNMPHVPPIGRTDILLEWSENSMLTEVIEPVLDAQECDLEGKYSKKTVFFFVADEFDEYLMRVYLRTQLGEMLRYPGVAVKNGLPVLMVFLRDYVQKHFLGIGENKYVVD